jgi:hypothetical protein
MAPVEQALYPIPQFSLYGDGRVIVTGPIAEIYPPAALPNLQTTVVSEETVQRMLSAAKDAGLFNPTFDYGQPGITDVGTTSILVNANGRSFETHVYALGYESEAGGLTDKQQQARAALQDLSSHLADLTGFVPQQPVWKSYGFTGIAVYSKAAQPNTSGSPGVQPNRLAWPLGDLATNGAEVEGGYRRMVVAGQDLTVLRPLLGKANTITLWESGGAFYNVFLRPLLPDQTS